MKQLVNWWSLVSNSIILRILSIIVCRQVYNINKYRLHLEVGSLLFLVLVYCICNGIIPEHISGHICWGILIYIIPFLFLCQFDFQMVINTLFWIAELDLFLRYRFNFWFCSSISLRHFAPSVQNQILKKWQINYIQM